MIGNELNSKLEQDFFGHVDLGHVQTTRIDRQSKHTREIIKEQNKNCYLRSANR